MGHYLWHLCSYEKVDYTSTERAIELFIQQRKGKCTIFFEGSNEAYLLEDASSLVLADLPYNKCHMIYADLYVMDWEQQWTFILTHEEQCGPYFISSVAIVTELTE